MSSTHRLTLSFTDNTVRSLQVSAVIDRDTHCQQPSQH